MIDRGLTGNFPEGVFSEGELRLLTLVLNAGYGKDVKVRDLYLAAAEAPRRNRSARRAHAHVAAVISRINKKSQTRELGFRIAPGVSVSSYFVHRKY